MPPPSPSTGRFVAWCMVTTFLFGAYTKLGPVIGGLGPVLLMFTRAVFLPQRKASPPVTARDALIGTLLGILIVIGVVVASNYWWPRSDDRAVWTHWTPWEYLFLVTMWGLWTWIGHRRWRESQCAVDLDPQPPSPGPAAPALAPPSPGPAAWTSTLPR